MWGKILLCSVLMVNLVGNVAIAAPSPPAKESEQKPQKQPTPVVEKMEKIKKDVEAEKSKATDRKKKATGAKDKAEVAKIASLDALKRMKNAKDEQTRVKEQTDAENKLDDLKKHQADAIKYAKEAQQAADSADKKVDESSTPWYVSDPPEVDKLQAQIESIAHSAQKEAADAQQAADAATSAFEIADTERKEALGEQPYADCGTWELECHLNGFFYNQARGILLAVIDMLKAAFHLGDLTNNPLVWSLKEGFSSLSWSFLLLFLVYQLVRILSLMILQEDYSEIKPLIRKTIIAAWLVSSLTWICDQLFILANAFTDYALDHLTKLKISINMIVDIVVVGSSSYLLILLVAIAVFCIIILIQIGIRSAEFAFLVIIGPVAIVTLVNKEMNMFNHWWRNLLAVIVAQAIQPVLFVLSIQMISKGALANIFAVIGFLVLTMRVPAMTNQWFQANSASTEAGGVMGGFKASKQTASKLMKNMSNGKLSVSARMIKK